MSNVADVSDNLYAYALSVPLFRVMNNILYLESAPTNLIWHMWPYLDCGADSIYIIIYNQGFRHHVEREFLNCAGTEN